MIEANLKACPAPTATATCGYSGSVSTMKSRSGGMVYMQVLIATAGRPRVGSVRRMNASTRASVAGLGSKVRVSRRHLVAAEILRHLDAVHLAVDGDAVEAGVVPPDPDGEAVGMEVAQLRRGVVGDLLLRRGQRQPHAERAQDLVGPGVGGHDQAAAAVDAAGRRHLDAVGERRDSA